MPDDRTMRERIAARLAKLQWSGADFYSWQEEYQADFLAKADAILDELREPTEAMEEAAKPFRKGVGEGAKCLWQAMIDAAKQERG